MEFVGCCYFSLGRHCHGFCHLRGHGVPYPPAILILESLIARIVGQFPFFFDDSTRETSRRLRSKRRGFLGGEFRRYNWNVCCLCGSCVGFVGDDPVPVQTRGLLWWSGESRYSELNGLCPRPIRTILGLYVFLLNAPRYSYFRVPDKRTVVDFLEPGIWHELTPTPTANPVAGFACLPQHTPAHQGPPRRLPPPPTAQGDPITRSAPRRHRTLPTIKRGGRPSKTEAGAVSKALEYSSPQRLERLRLRYIAPPHPRPQSPKTPLVS